MRIYIILTVFLFFPYRYSYSQTKFGLNSGLNFCTIKYNNEYQEDLIKPYRKIKTDIKGGIFLIQELNPLLFISSEIIYSRKGLKYEQPGTRTGNNKLNYAQWSVCGNIIILNKNYHKFSAGIGIYTSFWINGKNTYINLKTGEYISEKVDFQNTYYEYNRWDAGIVAALSHSKKKSPWFLSAKFEYGMLDSSREIADSFSNRLISASLGYFLSKK